MHVFSRFLLSVFTASLLVLAPAAQGKSTHLLQTACNRSAVPTDATGKPVNVTGIWAANDGGTYWIRQLGSCVWWAGFSGSPDTPTMGRNFANVFQGRAYSSTSTGRIYVTGYWVDVPRGVTGNSGTLLVWVRVDKAGKPLELVKLKFTGPFSGTRWTKIS